MNPLYKWFTPQESRIILFILISFVVGISVLMLGRKFPVIQQDVMIQGESAKEAAQDTIYDSPELKKAVNDSANAASFKQRTEKLAKPALASIDLNTAPKNTLTRLPGIGPKRALDIIAYRDKHGGFKTKKDIQKIKGIGVKTFEKMKKYLAPLTKIEKKQIKK